VCDENGIGVGTGEESPDREKWPMEGSSWGQNGTLGGAAFEPEIVLCRTVTFWLSDLISAKLRGLLDPEKRACVYWSLAWTRKTLIKTLGTRWGEPPKEA